MFGWMLWLVRWSCFWVGLIVLAFCLIYPVLYHPIKVAWVGSRGSEIDGKLFGGGEGYEVLEDGRTAWVVCHGTRAGEVILGSRIVCARSGVLLLKSRGQLPEGCSEVVFDCCHAGCVESGEVGGVKFRGSCSYKGEGDTMILGPLMFTHFPRF